MLVSAMMIAGCQTSLPFGTQPFADRYHVGFASRPECHRDVVDSVLGPTQTEVCASADFRAGHFYIAELQRLPDSVRIPSGEMMVLIATLRAANRSANDITSQHPFKLGNFPALDVTMQAKQGGKVIFARHVLIGHDIVTLSADPYDSPEMPPDARAFLESFVVTD